MRKILMVTVLFFSALALFFSCSDDNPAETATTGHDTQLQFKSVAVYNENPGSGSGTISEFADGDTIGLYLHDYHRGYPFPYIVRYHYWWQSSEPVFLSSDPMRVSAYYPYRQKEHAFMNDILVNVEHVSQTDYMYGLVNEGYVSREYPYVDILMRHVLALVQFKFVKNDYPHDCSVQQVSINNADGVTLLRSKGVLNLENGAVETLDGYYDKAAILPEDMNFNEPYTSEEKYARILVMPIEPVRNDGDLFFEFEIDGRTYTYPVKAGTFWESGMKYTYEVDMVPITRSLKSSESRENIRVVLTQTSKS
ncbi:MULTISPECIES: fimbrillin family protein [unclassified Dysgonomonas]|uniref:fimbrillin family protein n=1 Tax=unclassified Dysgonomonas TaxID=2630389 RepID=UPI0025C715BF|nr:MULTISPECIES: fimbrillin family protein [unclassified Dysgonomonas]HMM04773.1 fimbrillin family protein [Dysgonomonas sp.]